MTFEASIPYSEYLARTRIEEERNKRAFTGEEPLEPEEMLERQVVHVRSGGTVDDETAEQIRGWTLRRDELIDALRYYIPPRFDQQMSQRIGRLR